MLSLRRVRLVVILAVMAAGCANGGRPEPPQTEQQVVRTTAGAAVKTGADVFADSDFGLVQGLRVGLIANHTALVDTAHLGDLLAREPNVELVALFGPEHGIRGTTEAGATVRGGVDVRTGAAVHSLYGETHRPTPEMLEDVDVLVFDIQDVGARFYTFISTMGLSMQSAAEQNIPFIVLDRPNPIGGDYVSGFVLDPAHQSFVGLYPIPVAHGMTVGELAGMIKGERLLDGLEDLDLQVVEMEGWQRDMLWPETGLPWIAPSPNLPDFETAFVYAGTCFFEALNASEGRGTLDPFRQVGAPYVEGREMAADLQREELPGVSFEGIMFTPRSISGMSSSPKFEDEDVEGVRIKVVDNAGFRPVETGVYVIDAFRTYASEADAPLVSRPAWLTKLAGTERYNEMLARGASPQDIIASWKDEVAEFESRRRPYLLYD